MSDFKGEISAYESEVRAKSRALDRAKELQKISESTRIWNNTQNGFCLYSESSTVKEKKIGVPDECKAAILGLLETYCIQTIKNLLKT